MTVQLLAGPAYTHAYEAWYSFLSWVAKLSVLGVVFTQDARAVTTAVLPAVAIMTAATIIAVKKPQTAQAPE